MTRARILKRTAAGMMMLLLAAGCAQTGGNSPKTGPYEVVAERTPFYEKGPAQAYGPDVNLVKGDEVEVLDRGYGYSRVKNPSGRIGYVANEDIKPLPASSEPQAAATTGAARRPSSGGRSNEPVEGQPSDMPLPESTPVTDYRY